MYDVKSEQCVEQILSNQKFIQHSSVVLAHD